MYGALTSREQWTVRSVLLFHHISQATSRSTILPQITYPKSKLRPLSPKWSTSLELADTTSSIPTCIEAYKHSFFPRIVVIGRLEFSGRCISTPIKSVISTFLQQSLSHSAPAVKGTLLDIQVSNRGHFCNYGSATLIWNLPDVSVVTNNHHRILKANFFQIIIHNHNCDCHLAFMRDVCAIIRARLYTQNMTHCSQSLACVHEWTPYVVRLL